MPTYNVDGLTAKPFGKFFNVDGFTASPIQRIYNIGSTTSGIIFEAFPSYIYNNGDQNVEDTGGLNPRDVCISHVGYFVRTLSSAPSFNTASITLKTNGSQQYNGRGVFTNKAVSLDGASSLSINGYLYNSYPNIFLVLALIEPDEMEREEGGNGGELLNKSIVNLRGNTVGGYYRSWDISQYNNEYFVYAGIFTSDRYTFQFDVDSILIE